MLTLQVKGQGRSLPQPGPSDPAPVVEFFTRTGITAADGHFDFERCTRTMFVHRNKKRNTL
jgi:hypothetical protein